MDSPKKPSTKRKVADNNATVEQETKKLTRSETLVTVTNNATGTVEHTNPDEPRETHLQDQPGNNNTTSNEEDDDSGYETDTENVDLLDLLSIKDATTGLTNEDNDSSKRARQTRAEDSSHLTTPLQPDHFEDCCIIVREFVLGVGEHYEQGNGNDEESLRSKTRKPSDGVKKIRAKKQKTETVKNPHGENALIYEGGAESNLEPDDKEEVHTEDNELSRSIPIKDIVTRLVNDIHAAYRLERQHHHANDSTRPNGFATLPHTVNPREPAVSDAHGNHTFSHVDETTETQKNDGEQCEEPTSKKEKNDRAMKSVLYGTKGHTFVKKSNVTDEDFICHRGGGNRRQGNRQVLKARDKAFVDSKYHTLSSKKKGEVRSRFINDFKGRWLKLTTDNKNYYFVVTGQDLWDMVTSKFNPRPEIKETLIEQIEQAPPDALGAVDPRSIFASESPVAPVGLDHPGNNEENDVQPPVALGVAVDPRNIVVSESPVAPVVPDHPDNIEENDAPPPVALGVAVDPRNIVVSESPVAPVVPDHPDNIEDYDEMDYEQEHFFRESSARFIIGSQFPRGMDAPQEREKEDDTTALGLKIDQVIENQLDGINYNGNVEEQIRSGSLLLSEVPSSTSNMGDHEFYTSPDNSRMESAVLLLTSEVGPDVVDIQAPSLEQGAFDIESFDTTEEIDDVVLLEMLQEIFQSTDDIDQVISLPPDTDSHVDKMD